MLHRLGCLLQLQRFVMIKLCFFQMLFFLFFWMSSGAQTTKKNVNTNKKPIAKPAVTAQGGCFNYYPVKAGAVYKYLTTTFTKNNPEIAIFEIMYSYYAANNRILDGKSVKSLLKDEDSRNLRLPNQSGFTFFLKQPRRTDRVYYVCEPMDIDGKKINTLIEYQELMKEHSYITGYYTQVTEKIRFGSMVPHSVNYEDIPIKEYERLGTGVFNGRFLFSSSTDGTQYVARNQEIRQDRSENGMQNHWEYRQTHYLGTIPEAKISGKLYKNIIGFGDRVYKSTKGSVPGQKELICFEENYYAQGVGLVKRIRFEKPIQQNYHQLVYKNLLGQTDNSEIITIWDLIPPGFNVEKEASEMALTVDDELMDEFNKTIDEEFYNSGTTNRVDSYGKNIKISTKASAKEGHPQKILSGEIDKRLIGFWVIPHPNRISEKYSYRFNADGTYEYDDYRAFNEKIVLGSWRVDKGKLYLQKNNAKTSDIEEIDLIINTDSKTGKPSFVTSTGGPLGESRYYQVKEDEINTLLSKTKPEWKQKIEEEPLLGEIIKDFVGTWVNDIPQSQTVETYIFNADGTGLWIKESKRSSARQYKNRVKINWRIKNGVLQRQTICDQPPCPLGEKFIEIRGIELTSDKGHPMIKVGGYQRFYKK